MLVPNNNPQGYKKHVISFIATATAFAFVEGFTIIDWLANMKNMCMILRNHINTQSLKIWEIQIQKNYYYTYYSVGVHVQLLKKTRI